MKEYLIFQLYGAMASWGEIAVGGDRHSYSHPSKSAITGLIAAALGICREEDDRQMRLAESISMAVRVDAMGQLLRDYHTTQVPPAKGNIVHETRKSELEAQDLSTILSSRDYYCDAAYTVAISLNEDAPYTLAEIRDNLRYPTFTLYLGRKSCPLSIPLNPLIVSALDLKAAFCQVPVNIELIDHSHHRVVKKGDKPVYWDISESGIEVRQVQTRRDAVYSRVSLRWQFSDRQENYGIIEEASHVHQSD